MRWLLDLGEHDGWKRDGESHRGMQEPTWSRGRGLPHGAGSRRCRDGEKSRRTACWVFGGTEVGPERLSRRAAGELTLNRRAKLPMLARMRSRPTPGSRRTPDDCTLFLTCVGSVSQPRSP